VEKAAVDIFRILGAASPAALEEMLGWIEDELARDERILGRPLAYEDRQRSYTRAVAKFRRRPTFLGGSLSKRPLRLVKD
jgi:hypothetical protein